MSGGAYKPMTEDQMQRVLDAALELLEEVGMGGPVPEFIEVVTDAGGWMAEEDRLHMPRKLVEEAIETAKKEWVWHGFDESLSAEIGGDKVHFSTAGAAVLRLDHATSEFLHPTALDIYDSARLADTLEHIHIYLRTIVSLMTSLARVSSETSMPRTVRLMAPSMSLSITIISCE